MSEPIYPRSPRETMCGWLHLPRYLDKIRLHLAGQLHADYQPNFGKGFDGAWLKAAGLTHESFIEVVRGTLCDGQVADWVLQNVKKTDAEKQAHAACECRDDGGSKHSLRWMVSYIVIEVVVAE